MELMIGFVWLCLFISANAEQNNHAVVCYADVAMLNLGFPLNPTLCTHIIYSTAYLDEDFSFKTMSHNHEGCSWIKKLKERNPNLKPLLGVTVTQSRLELLAQNPPALEGFISSSLDYVQKKDYEGVELAWLENTDRTLNTGPLTYLLKEFKERIGNYTDPAGNKALIVALSLFDQKNNNIKPVAQYTDFMTLLPSSLYSEGKQVDGTVQYWQDQGVDPKKLFLALPVFVRWPSHRPHVFSSRTAELYPQSELNNASEPRQIVANQVCMALKSGQTELKILTKVESAQSHAEEVEWLLQKRLGGVGVVIIDIDHFGKSICPDSMQSEAVLLESNVITAHDLYARCIPHHHHRHHGHHHHGHRRHGDRHHGHRHHGDRHHGDSHHGHRHHGHRHNGHLNHRLGRGHHHHGHGYRGLGHGHRQHGAE